MKTKLLQLTKRIEDLEKLAEEVLSLAKKLSLKDLSAQPELSIKGQRWYRGARELLVQQNFSGLQEFDACYDSAKENRATRHRSFTDIEQYITEGMNPYHSENLWSGPSQGKEYFGLFSDYFQKARSLLLSVVDEIFSKELEVVTQLSFVIATDEFQTAEAILVDNPKLEIIIRTSGVIARIALERHLLTVANARSIEIKLNPPTKKKQDIGDVLSSLEKAFAINAIQKSELEGLFKIGNYCAHPKETVTEGDVKRLITRGRELAAIIL